MALADGSADDIPPELRGQPLLALSVSDTGMGIPADKFRRIFNAFEQVDASTSRQFGGTGLGLAISRRIARLLGGELGVHSELGVGSRFVLWLPLHPAEDASVTASAIDAEVPAAPAQPTLAPRHPGAGASLLVIEDDVAFAGVLAGLVEEQGHRVLVAHDGESGLRLAREQHPDGILLDVTLPTIDGWTVLSRLQAQPQTVHIPVHVISASDEATRAKAEGAVGFLVKPVTRESIAAALQRVLPAPATTLQRVLVVDDDPAARHAIGVELHGVGVQLDEAASAEDALAQIARRHYDCIVLDLGLPGMSGLEMLEQLSAATGGTPPVVVYSGRNLSAVERAQLRQHTRAIVPKATRVPEQLRAEVCRFLLGLASPVDRARHTPILSTRLAGRHLLLVDDDMRNLFALSKVLRDWGLNVLMAQNGQKALDLLAEHAEVQVVLMDIMMPVMDGYTAIAAIRAQAAPATLPVIALTAKAMAGDRERCIDAGASDYLSKPVDLDQLAAKLEHWLGAAGTQKETQA
jgi:CheY-like chemotaxis protein